MFQSLGAPCPYLIVKSVCISYLWLGKIACILLPTTTRYIITYSGRYWSNDRIRQQSYRWQLSKAFHQIGISPINSTLPSRVLFLSHDSVSNLHINIYIKYPLLNSRVSVFHLNSCKRHYGSMRHFIDKIYFEVRYNIFFNISMFIHKCHSTSGWNFGRNERTCVPALSFQRFIPHASESFTYITGNTMKFSDVYFKRL